VRAISRSVTRARPGNRGGFFVARILSGTVMLGASATVLAGRDGLTAISVVREGLQNLLCLALASAKSLRSWVLSCPFVKLRAQVVVLARNGRNGRNGGSGRRAWQEAERKTTVDHTLMRGLVTAGPSIRLGAASVFLRASTWSAAKGPSRVPWKLCLRRCASATWTYLRSRLPGCGPCSTESDRVTTVRRVGRGGR
jgi:hypothetical protein